MPTFVLPAPIGGTGSGSGTPGVNGKSVELRVTATAIQWRQTGGTWTDLVQLADLTGTNGQSVELQKTDTAIQWRLTGGTWVDLVQLSDLVVDGGSGSAVSSVNTKTGDVVLTAADVGAADTATVDAIDTRLTTAEGTLENAVTYDANGNITAHYIFAGRLSDDGSGNYVPDGGGILIGGINGVRYRQEGFIADNDEGSIAAYPNVANRANRLALCPSGDPANLPGEDTASFALQHLNGSYEQRFVLVSKKAGEYRIASVATGVGLNFPVTVASGNYRMARFETDTSTTFTAEPLSGTTYKNTVVKIAQPAVSQFVRIFGRTNGQFGFEYVNGAATLDYRLNGVGMAIGGSDASRRFSALVDDTVTGGFFGNFTSTGYAGIASQIDVARASTSAYAFFLARSSSATSPDTEFNLRGDGSGFCDGAWNAGGADYAEFFEWADGNPNADDRVGYTVVLEGEKIRLALAGEDPFGVVSAVPSVVGNAAWNAWNGKYLRDVFGRILTDADGNKTLNPDFDESLTYVPREDRPEWSEVGLMGRLRIRKGQPTGSRWLKLKDVDDTVEEWLVR